MCATIITRRQSETDLDNYLSINSNISISHIYPRGVYYKPLTPSVYWHFGIAVVAFKIPMVFLMKKITNLKIAFLTLHKTLKSTVRCSNFQRLRL